MAQVVAIKWLSEPADHDYPAAESYLCLLYDEATAKQQVEQLRQAPVSTFKAKDIFRASGLSLLGISNAHVEKDQRNYSAWHLPNSEGCGFYCGCGGGIKGFPSKASRMASKTFLEFLRAVEI